MYRGSMSKMLQVRNLPDEVHARLKERAAQERMSLSDYVAQELGLGSKVKHEGHEMWIKCMARDKDAWRAMEKYNRQDVALLEKLYDRLRPWIRNHPNRGLYDDGIACVTCGSQNLQRRGIQRTVNTTYARLQCNDCGSWMRSAIRGERRPVPMRHAA